ncbi:MAG TPA: hypothetical protein VK563_00260 [Puia sp.]|nr:hypothetical protein [Puia sp.]
MRLALTGIIGLILITGTIAYGQTSVINLPQVIPPPPDAAALGKYGDIPVSLNTGNANISVPLYEIKTPRLTLPVTLNYSASGIKVDEMASWVGLEWSLNAGGVITRSIRGLDDFATRGYYNTTVPLANNVTANNSWAFFQAYMYHTQDADPDFFFYNFQNYSGKFIFGENKDPIIINYQQPLKFQYIAATKTFSVLDEKGNSYYFGALENNAQSGDYHGSPGSTYTSSWYLSKIVSFDKSDSISFTYFTDNLLEQDSWAYLETIGPSWYTAYFNNMAILQYTSSGQENCCGAITGEPYSRSYPLRLQEIDYKNGKINFFSSATRSDQATVKLDSVIVSQYDYATQQYGKLKKIKLNYDYYQTSLPNQPSTFPSPFRLRLDSVNISGNDNSYGGNYKFVYDSTMLPWINSNAKDLFGYYNGKLFNASMIPTQTLSFSGLTYTVGAADRTVNPDSIQAGILKRIYYPTGGYSNFTYEPNSYFTNGTSTQTITKSARATGQMGQNDTTTFVAPISGPAQVTLNISRFNYGDVITRPSVSMNDLTLGQNSSTSTTDAANGLSSTIVVNLIQGDTYRLTAGAYDDGHVFSNISVTWQQTDTSIKSAYGGGLRIRQVDDYGFDNRFLKGEQYRYGLNECGYGTLSGPVNLLNSNSYVANFAYSAGDVNCAPGAITQRMIFAGSSKYDVFTLTGAPVSYPQVTKYQVDLSNNNLGKTVFNYSAYSNTVMPAAQSYIDAFYILNTGWQGGQLLSEEHYSNKAGKYWPVKRTYTSYINPMPQQGRGLKIGFTRSYQGIPAMDSLSMVIGCFYPMFYYFDYPLYAGSVLASNQTVLDYDMMDTLKYVTSTKQFSYDNLDHLQPTRITSNTSDGGSLLTINRYPEEVDSITNLSGGEIAAIDSLKSRHNLTTLIQTQTFRNSSPVDLTRYDYKVWPNNMVLPDSIESQISGFPMEKRIQVNAYDNAGNTLQDSRASDVSHSYVWNYNNAYPVAEAVNAAQADVAYTSFEADGTGNWNAYTGTITKATSAPFPPTGSAYYNLTTSATLNKPGLTTGKIYIISYWSANGVYSISGGTAVSGYLTGKQIGSWTYYEHKILSTSSTLIISGTGSIDEVRLYPSDAQMTTYTYSPLLGMTSQCDADNRVSYYSYDGLGRLRVIKDQDGNILKTMEYHYMTQ